MILISISLILSTSFNKVAEGVLQKDFGEDNRIEELNQYWADLAKSAKEGDFEGMKSLYHEDAVLVKPDTTISVTEAFKYRWKKEIMEVKNGKRANSLDFRFSKRVGNDITAFEQGVYHYTSIDTDSGESLGNAFVHFETLLVKVGGNWVCTMEYQKGEATQAEWDSLN